MPRTEERFPLRNELGMRFDIPFETLLYELASQPPDTIFNFIARLDLQVGEYDFTERIAKHFISEIRKEHEVSGEEFDINILLDNVDGTKA